MNLTSLITAPARAGLSIGRRAFDIATGRSTQAVGAARRRFGASPELDDVTLARKVETEIFRSRRVAKGKIDVNVVDGVVWLRGEAKNPELINEIEAKAAAIPEVKRVENLLHLPKTPARRPRSKAAAPKRASRARKAGAPPKRTTAEKRTAAADSRRRSARPRTRRPAAWTTRRSPARSRPSCSATTPCRRAGST